MDVLQSLNHVLDYFYRLKHLVADVLVRVRNRLTFGLGYRELVEDCYVPALEHRALLVVINHCLEVQY